MGARVSTLLRTTLILLFLPGLGLAQHDAAGKLRDRRRGQLLDDHPHRGILGVVGYREPGTLNNGIRPHSHARTMTIVSSC